METGLLRGYRAIEVGDRSGMYAGKVLGDLGCEVVRIEPPDGHPLRRQALRVPWEGGEVSAEWLAYNTSKRSVALDIERPEGRALLDRLLDSADLLIAAGSVAWLAERRLGPGEVRAG